MPPESFRARPLGRATQWMLLASPVLLLAAMAAIPLLFAVPFERIPLAAKLQTAGVPILFGIGALFLVKFRQAARLVVDDAGIRLDTGLPTWVGSAGWRLAWNEIAGVRTLGSMGVVQLQRKGSLVRHPLRVHDWVPEKGEATAAPPWLSLKPPDIRTAPLWKCLERRGLFGRAATTPSGADFDLAKHPATRAALVAMAALMAYAAADFFLARERWAVLEPAIFAVPGAIGAVGGLLAFWSLVNADRAGKLPLDVAGPVAGVVGLAVACAAFYGLLRVNQWVAPLEAHPYVRNAGCNALEPVEPGLPVIEYDDPARRYWCSFPRETRHTVLLRRGLGGMYQVDLTEHTRGIRDFNARAAAAVAQPR